MNAKRTLSRTSSFLALCVCTQIAGPAVAQTVTPMPATHSIDDNGVDLINWSFSYELASISLGPPDQDPLKSFIQLPTERDSFSSNLRVQDPSWNSSTSVSASVGSSSWSFLGVVEGGGIADPGAYSLVYDDHGEVHARDGTVIWFQFPSWYVPGTVGPVNFCATSITKPNGEVLTFYNENSGVDCRTRSIVSSRGYQIRYEYPTTGWTSIRTKITLVNAAYDYCNPTATSCTLTANWPSVTITDSGSTRTYTDNAGRAWSRTSTGLLGPGETTPGINWATATYIAPSTFLGQVFWRVTSVTRAGQTWTYTYPSSDPTLGGDNTQLIRIQDPLGNVRRVRRIVAISSGDPTYGEFESPNLAYKAVNELGGVTNYSYNGQNLLTNVTYPEGNGQSATYDARGNPLTSVVVAKPGSGLPNLTTTYTYDAWNDKPITITDPKGNVTNYTYDPVHGGVLTETKPAPVSGGIRPVKRYAYSQHYAWVKNASGGYAQAATPIWLVDSEKTCRTTATVSGACSGGSSDEVVTTYDYGPAAGPNNLWLRGKVVTADGVSHRTCYTYDKMGNKLSETSPRAGLTSCP